jgi:hypothetical protein
MSPLLVLLPIFGIPIQKGENKKNQELSEEKPKNIY